MLGNTGLKLALILLVLSTTSRAADFGGYNIVNPNTGNPSTPEGQAALMKAASGNTMADGLAGPMYNTDTSKIDYSDKQQQDNSRKNAAATAGSSSGTGQGVHAAVGAAMAATATPMLMSIDPVVRAAGAALMAKAIIEFAQSGADGGVKDKNNAQKDLLTQTANQDQQAKADAKLPPEAQKLLAERGVNPDDFAEKLTNGEIGSTQDVLKALGDEGEFSADQLAAGDAMADGEMGKIFAETHPIEATMDKLGYDESNVTTSGSGGVVGGGRGASSDLDKLLADAAGNPAGAGHTWAPNNTSANRGKDGGDKAALAGAAMPSAADLLNSLLGGKAGAPESQAMKDLMNRLGIAKANKKQNIFHIATRNYRSWGKWRKNVLRLVAVQP